MSKLEGSKLVFRRIGGKIRPIRVSAKSGMTAVAVAAAAYPSVRKRAKGEGKNFNVAGTYAFAAGLLALAHPGLALRGARVMGRVAKASNRAFMAASKVTRG